MKSIDEGLRALSFVQAVIPGAVLAGGYLRDAINERPQKDIDIFVPAGNWDWDAIGGSLAINAAMYMEQTEVDSVFELSKTFGEDDGSLLSLLLGGLPVQVIQLAPGLTPTVRAMQHDFGICQVWHDGKTLQWTPAFAEDCANRTFTLLGCENKAEFARSMRRFERLKDKYPEFTLVIPEEFRQWQ